MPALQFIPVTFACEVRPVAGLGPALSPPAMVLAAQLLLALSAFLERSSLPKNERIFRCLR